MLLNRADFDKLVAPGMNTRYIEGAAQSAATQTWDKLADLVQSTQGAETYPMIGAMPGFTKFRGERRRRKLNQYSFVVTNEEYEDTVAITRAMIDDDNEQYAKLQDLAARLGRQFPVFLEQQVYALIESAYNTNCYDGQYMVDTDHSEGNSGSQSNKGTSALDATSYAAGRAAMMKFKDDQGRPAGKMPTVLLVPADLDVAARTILNATIVSSTTNVQAGTTELVVSPYLTDTNNWFLLDTRVDKPFFIQERIKLEVGSKSEFDNNELDYGGYWRGAFAFADWRNLYGGIVA